MRIRLILIALAATAGLIVAAPAQAGVVPSLMINGHPIHQQSDPGTTTHTVNLAEAFYLDGQAGNFLRDWYRSGQYTVGPFGGVTTVHHGGRTAWSTFFTGAGYTQVIPVQTAAIDPNACPYANLTGGDGVLCGYLSYPNGGAWSAQTATVANANNGRIVRTQVRYDYIDMGATRGNQICQVNTWDQALGTAHIASLNCGNFAQGAVNHEIGHTLGLDHPLGTGGVAQSPLGVSYYYHPTQGTGAPGQPACQSVCTDPGPDDYTRLNATSNHIDDAAGTNAAPAMSAAAAGPVKFDPTPLPKADEGAPLTTTDLGEAKADGKFHAITVGGLRAEEVKNLGNGTVLIREDLPAPTVTGKFSKLEDIPPGYWREVERKRLASG